MLAGDLEIEGDLDLALFTGGQVLDSRASIRSDYGPLREAGSVVNESVLSTMAELLSLAIRGVEAMKRDPSWRYESVP